MNRNDRLTSFAAALAASVLFVAAPAWSTGAGGGSGSSGSAGSGSAASGSADGSAAAAADGSSASGPGAGSASSAGPSVATGTAPDLRLRERCFDKLTNTWLSTPECAGYAGTYGGSVAVAPPSSSAIVVPDNSNASAINAPTGTSPSSLPPETGTRASEGAGPITSSTTSSGAPSNR